MQETVLFSDVPIPGSIRPPGVGLQSPKGQGLATAFISEPIVPPFASFDTHVAPAGPTLIPSASPAVLEPPPSSQVESTTPPLDEPLLPTPELELEGPPASRASASVETLPSSPRRFNWLPAASIFAGLLLVIGSWSTHHPSEAGASGVEAPSGAPANFDLSVPRWPATFNASASAARVTSDAALLPNKTIDDMVYTYEYYVGQQYRIRTLSEEYPDLRASLSGAQRRFDERFLPSIEAMQRILGEWNPDRWQEVRRITEAWASRAGTVHLPADRARGYLDTVAARAMGKLSPRVLDTLLAFNPNYLANPAREYRDGYVREFLAADSVSGELKIRLKYPRSWTGERSNDAAILQRFRDRRSVLTLISVKTAKLSDLSIDSARDLTELLSLADLRGMHPDARLTDAGVLPLSGGHEALWREMRLTYQAPEGMQKLKAVDFTVVSAGCLVCVTFSSAAPAAATDAQLDAIYAHNAPLFKLIISSLDISR